MQRAELFAAFGAPFLRSLLRTVRVRLTDRSGLLASSEPRASFAVFWHNRMLIMPHVFERYIYPRPGAALTSASKDGAVVAAILRRFGMRPVRGSSSRRGGPALVEMRRLLDERYIIGVTPDGPRGPRYRFQGGVVKLAQLTGHPVLPIHVNYSHFWRLKTWDGFMIPRPFTTADVMFGDFITVSATADAHAFDAERARLEGILRPGPNETD